MEKPNLSAFKDKILRISCVAAARKPLKRLCTGVQPAQKQAGRQCQTQSGCFHHLARSCLLLSGRHSAIPNVEWARAHFAGLKAFTLKGATAPFRCSQCNLCRHFVLMKDCRGLAKSFAKSRLSLKQPVCREEACPQPRVGQKLRQRALTSMAMRISRISEMQVMHMRSGDCLRLILKY